MQSLSDPEIQQALQHLPDWKHEGCALVRTTTFPTFMRAVDFVQAVAEIAEGQDHHPDIEIRYHRVTLRYWTHRAKGVTLLDFTGAQAVESQIPVFQAKP